MIDIVRRFAAMFNLFPCPVCRKGDGGGANRFCPECEREMHRIGGVRCRGCGGELDGALALCSTCLIGELRPWIGAVSIYEYRDLTRKVMHGFKFFNRPELARPFGELAAEKMREEEFKPDLVIPIPLHITRYWFRSFNQAELFGRVVASELGVHLENRVLRRVKRTKHQAHLGRKERMTNPFGVFAVRNPERIQGKRILLVDDVFTTGATLGAAAQVLMEAGAGSIFVLTAARTPRY